MSLLLEILLELSQLLIEADEIRKNSYPADKNNQENDIERILN